MTQFCPDPPPSVKFHTFFFRVRNSLKIVSLKIRVCNFECIKLLDFVKNSGEGLVLNRRKVCKKVNCQKLGRWVGALL